MTFVAGNAGLINTTFVMGRLGQSDEALIRFDLLVYASDRLADNRHYAIDESKVGRAA